MKYMVYIEILTHPFMVGQDFTYLRYCLTVESNQSEKIQQ
jgi:hypothetical protein